MSRFSPGFISNVAQTYNLAASFSDEALASFAIELADLLHAHFTDDAVFGAQLAVTPPDTLLAADFIDEAAFGAQLDVTPPDTLVAADFVDEAVFGAQIAVTPPDTLMAANFVDEAVFGTGIVVTPPEVLLAADFVDEALATADLFVVEPTLLAANFVDEAVFGASLDIVENDPSGIFGADLAAWYKADAGVTTVSGLVSAWADQSGNNVNLAQSNSSFRPTLSATGFNGHPCLVFNPTNSTSSSSNLKSADGALAMGGNHSTFALLRWRTKNTRAEGNWVHSFNRASSGDFPWNNVKSAVWAFWASDTNFRSMVNSTGLGAIAASTIATATIYNLSTNADGTNWRNYLNNTLLATTANTATLNATGRLELGSEVGAENSTAGNFDLAELVIVKRGATDAERALVNTYFQNKWGVTLDRVVTAGSFTDDTPGTRSYTVPAYNTMVIEVWGGGSGTGTTIAPGTSGTYVQCVDATATAIPALSLSAGGATSPSSVFYDATGGVGGTASGGDVNVNGENGETGSGSAAPITAIGGKGGDSPNGGTGGAARTETTTGSFSYAGNPGNAPGGGGGSPRQTANIGGFKAFWGGSGGGGAYVKKTFNWNDPGAPGTGDILSYTVGAKGTGGRRTASPLTIAGTDGADGRLKITIT